MRKLIILAAVCTLAACSQPPEENGEKPDRISDRVSKFCDFGRAVYIYNGRYERAGSVFVIDHAAECKQPLRGSGT
jgi:hypothetical protein